MMLPQNPPYTKPFLDLPAQIRLLKSRGLNIKNDQHAEECLHRIGYYRLSAYLYPFRTPLQVNPPQRSNQFLSFSHFEDALSLYLFDKKLKMLVLDAIEQVEVAVRVEIAMLLGQRRADAYTNLSYLDPGFGFRGRNGVPDTVKGNSEHGKWLNRMNSLIDSSREEFVNHYLGNYARPLPIWIAIELWDFGMMSCLYRGLKVPDKQSIANKFNVANWNLLQSWLRSLNFVRNIVAHHARLWNRVLADHPTLPRLGQMRSFDVLNRNSNVDKRIYSVLCILSYLLRTINPMSSWKYDVAALATTFPQMPHAKLSDAGFPTNWQSHSFW